MKKTETEQILEYLKHIDESINGPRPKARPSRKEPPLSKRVDGLDQKFGGLGRKVEGLDKKVGGLGRKVEGLDKKVGGLGRKVGGLDKKVEGLGQEVEGLGQKIDKLDTRVSEVQLGLATLAADTKAQFQKVDERFTRIDARFDTIDARFTKVDKRFDKVDRSIETTRVQLVGLVELVHNELTGRIIDLEGPGTKGSGGGVPLAS
jgi:archaellum component FlaC